MTDEPWVYADGCREDQPRHLGDSEEHATVVWRPGPISQGVLSRGRIRVSA